MRVWVVSWSLPPGNAGGIQGVYLTWRDVRSYHAEAPKDPPRGRLAVPRCGVSGDRATETVHFEQVEVHGTED